MIRNDTFINNLWYDSVGLAEDWSWLNVKPELFYSREEMFDQDGIKEFITVVEELGLSDLNIERCFNRFYMGQMRYGTKFKDLGKSYYWKRLAVEIDRLTYNLEALYDYINIAWIMYRHGYIKLQWFKELVTQIIQAALFYKPPFNPEDRV